MIWSLKANELDKVLQTWSAIGELYTPQTQYGEIQLLPYRKGMTNLNYINFAQPVKEFVFKTKETLFDWHKSGDEVLIEVPKPEMQQRILFGVRACDAKGFEYMDKFFQQEFCDDPYKANRESTTIVAISCTKPGKNCFCESQQCGPIAREGSDLALTPFQQDYHLEAVTEKGNQLLQAIQQWLIPVDEQESAINSAAIIEETSKLFQKKIEAMELNKVLKDGYQNQIWDRYADKCIRCGGCTNVCPTCTCFNVVEENSTCDTGKRLRCIDSCQCDSFTRNAGDHTPRNAAARVRYRIYDKLKYIEDRFEMKGCTGCGRCITTCPVDIDIVKTANLLYKQQMAEQSKKDQIALDLYEDRSGFTIHQHGNCEQVYVPKLAVIKEILEETRSIKRFVLELEDKELRDKLEQEPQGQFFEITVFGIGEIAISIPFSPSQGSSGMDFCVKNVGKVTKALHAMKPGDKVGLRGPFGKGFPIEQMKGRDILIIGSGVGIAPVRTVVMQIAEQREQFGRVSVIGSALSYENLIYKEDFIHWGKKCSMDVMYALNKPTEMVDAHVGYINDLLPKLANDWSNTTAVICASPRRIKEVAKDLLKLGVHGTQILTSLETHMRCGIGKCGHCKVGNKYMCVDGPVFNYDEMLQLPPEF